MEWTNPYKSRKGTWLRGNLHTHSGEGMTQEEIFGAYGRLGYDFLCISDHRKLTRPALPRGSRLMLIPGFEWNSKTGDHMNLFSLEAPALLDRCARTSDPEQCLKWIRGKPVLMVLNHPNWREPPHYSRETLFERAPAATGMEIYNGLVDFGSGTALATEKWDYLLSRRRMVLGFANDDAHQLKHIGQAWIMARAASRTPKGVFAALRAGNFYCSTGASFTEIKRKGERITVESPDAQEIWAIGEWGARLDRTAGGRMEFDFTARPSRYVRFVAYGRGAAMAWTQPFLRTPDIDDRRFSPFVGTWSVSGLVAKGLSAVKPADAEAPGMAWRTLQAMAVPEGFMNVASLHGQAHGTVFLKAEVTVPRAGTWIAALGHDGGARLFVDGRQVLAQPVRANPAVPDRSRATLRLARGTHRLLVALDTDHGKGQGIFLRFILPGGKPFRQPFFPATRPIR